ncbi:hypothetical protein WG954_05230 [Lacibacter sp. H375]|uniref:hypothetical protein n=1 Tax=Lacibacter sp. H375 TaxID=3133424 RepID=UPI0030BD4569
MFTKYQLPQLIFPVKGNKIWLAVLLLAPSFTGTAQNLPKNPTLQQLAGYHNKQQQNWQQKQLPQSSVTYKFSTNYGQSSTSEVRKVPPSVPVSVNYPLPASASTIQQTTPAPFLQSFLLEERKQYMLWQKQSWWKDPGKLKGAELLRDFYIANRKN